MSRQPVLILPLVIAIAFFAMGCESLDVMPGQKPGQKPAQGVPAAELPLSTATADGPEWSISVSPSRLRVNTAVTVSMVFTLRAERLAPGGGLKILFPKSITVRGYGEMQDSDPSKPNYVTLRSSNPSAQARIARIKSFDPRTPWDDDVRTSILSVLVEGAGLVKGDSIEIVFGANPPAGRFRTNTFAYTDELWVVADLDGSGTYRQVSPTPSIETVPSQAFRLGVILPSIAVAGEPVTARIVALDQTFNIANATSAVFALSSNDDAAELPSVINMGLKAFGRVEFTVLFKSPGIRRVRVRREDGQMDTLSNPVKVIESAPAERIYWGDLHSHTKHSYDAVGQGLFEYARDAANLDFCAITDHTTTEAGVVSINPREWDEIRRHVASANAPGRFVTILGYEYNALAPTSHHNVFFDTVDERLMDIPLITPYAWGDVKALWRELDRRGIKYITIPHHTGKNLYKSSALSSAAVSFGPGFANSTARPLLEIYSYHGQSEAYNPAGPMSYEAFSPYGLSINGPHYAQDALALGEYLGFVASSDTHFARPGLHPFGLAAVYSKGLTREALFDAMRNRRTYATTGERMIVDFSVASAPMGARVTIGDRKPEVRVEVNGTDVLEFVEVLRFTGKMEAGHPVFETIRRTESPGRSHEETFVDETFRGGPAVYYMRARQQGLVAKREIWAWSSPVWVNY